MIISPLTYKLLKNAVMITSAVLIAGRFTAPHNSGVRSSSLVETGSMTDAGRDSVCDRSENAFRNVHVVRPSAEYSSEPFFPDNELVITWQTDLPAQEASIVIGTDPELIEPIGVIRGENDGSMAIPDQLLTTGGVYYYRVYVRPFGAETLSESAVRWFAIDRRFTGNRIVSLGYHPLGKSECSVTVRDAQGVVHMAMEHWIGDTGDREVIWLSSDDDGRTWLNHGAVSLPEHTFAGLPSIAVDDAGETLCIGYLAGTDSYHMPRPVAICRCDLTRSDPSFEIPYVFCGQKGCAWRRPFLAIDENEVVHAVWDGPFSAGPCDVKVKQIWYSNNFSGDWQDPLNVASHPDDPVGGCHLACVAGEIHALWEGGIWRYTQDYGITWEPPLSEPAARMIADGVTKHEIRWRIGSSTRIPGRDEIVVAMIGERREGCGDNWTFMSNLDEIWLTRYRPGLGWSFPECVYSLDDEVITTEHPADDQKVLFIERPDISADGSGRIYLAWDETRGTGDDRSRYHREGYLMWSREDGSFTEPVELPEIGSLNTMKPLLGEARMEPGCDITWAVGEIPPMEARPVRTDSPLTIQGIMFATDLDLEKSEPVEPPVFEGVFDTTGDDPEYDPACMEGSPRLRPTDALRARMLRDGYLDDVPDEDAMRIDVRLMKR